MSVKAKLLLLIFLAALLGFAFCLPGKLFNNPTSYVIEDSNGNLLNAVIAADGQWRFPYNKEVPQKFIDCITTFEDKRFFYHPGIDPVSVLRAARANFSGEGNTQGGSTITMQVMRLSGVNRKRNIWNKLKESIRALRLECSYSKKEILALYASHAPFGSNVVGLDAASWRYFGRPADKLSWSEMATLAVLPNSPALIHPGRNRNKLLEKRNRLLEKLVVAGIIDKQTCLLAMTEALPDKPVPLPQFAPHLLQRYKKEKVNSENTTRLKTTIDGRLQKEVSRIIDQHYHQLKGNQINNICALVLDVQTGNTLAYAGNIVSGFKENENEVDIINASRSPGSALKPVLYAAMLSDGIMLPDALVPDVPTEIAGYAPENFDKTYDGAVPAGMALARSLNVPAVRLLQQYKYQRFYEVLQKCGIKTLNKPASHYGLSLILGGCEVNMWQLAGLYASMARSLINDNKNKGQIDPGDFHEPRYSIQKKFISEVKDIPLNTTSVYFTFQAMQEVMRPGEEGLWQQFSSSKRIAWKTGTSYGFRDGWSIGVTPKYVVAVWTGNADGEGRPGLTGISTAAPAMFDIFRLLPSAEWFTRPSANFAFIPVCRETGFRAGIDCPLTDTLFMPPLASRSLSCPYHRIIHLDETGNYQVNENCLAVTNMTHKAWFILTPAMEYYYKQKNPGYKILPPFLPGCTTSDVVKQIDILYPQQDAKIYVPREISGEKGRTIFTATHRVKDSKIFWSIDDTYITTTAGNHQIEISPLPGSHILTLTDAAGSSVNRRFIIIDKKEK